MAETNMLMLLNRYNEWADQIETSLFNWVDPDEGWKLHPYQHYPLANFASVFAMCMGYLAFVLIGSWIMKNDRIPAFNTSMIQFFYNPLQIIVCSYMCIEAALQAYRNVSLS
jgi:elongation of very long chain fatty acids protein 4